MTEQEFQERVESMLALAHESPNQPLPIEEEYWTPEDRVAFAG